MKKILTLLLSAAVMLTMISCNIEAPRAFTGTVTLKVTNIPKSSEAKALSIFCNVNNWDETKINGSDVYVVPIEYTDSKGIATFILENYPYSEKFSFQFAPMKDETTKLTKSWWQNAISGSSSYSKEKNNLIYRFSSSTGSSIGLKLNLDDVYGDKAAKLSITGTNRLNTENFAKALEIDTN